MTPMFRRLGAVAVTLALATAACSDDDSDGDSATATTAPTASASSTFDRVTAAGTVKCGTRDALPGFSVLNASGEHVGFDADFCRVIAAAVLGDSTKVTFVDLATESRFTALQSGEIDVLVRNTTWTASRDGKEGATFLQPNFYDGQGMMVAASSSIRSLANMDNTTVCVASGTTTEGNVASEFSRRGLDVEVLSFESTDLIQQAFTQDRCDGWSSDTSQLTSLRSAYPASEGGAAALRILPEVFSKEPLAPAVRDGDSKWAQVVNWAVLSTIQAEEFGITSANVDTFLTSTDPAVKAFLGVATDGTTLDPGLGLAPDFARKVVTQVGNYGEIYAEHLTPLGLDRGLNRPWNAGGILYAPPYR